MTQTFVSLSIELQSRNFGKLFWGSQETASKLFCDGVERFPHLRLVKPREDEGAWLFFGMAVTWLEKQSMQ